MADEAKVHANVFLGHPEPKDVSMNGNGNGVNGVSANGGSGGNGANGGPAFGLRVDLCVEGVEDDGIIQAAHAVSLFFRLSISILVGVIVQFGGLKGGEFDGG